MNPLAMIDMKSKLKGTINKTAKNSTINSFTISNLDNIESKLIKEIIHGEKVAEEVSTRNPIISLDDAINIIKKKP